LNKRYTLEKRFGYRTSKTNKHKQMNKNWKKKKEGEYVFSVDNVEIGTMEIAYDSLETKAICKLEGNAYVIKRAGFWKSAIEISKESGQNVAKIYPRKWFASTWILQYKNEKYTLKVRNNPLVEYVLLHNEVEIAAYALNTDNNQVNVKITTANNTSDYLFDFLLWYLFLPVAIENMNDHIVFSTLLNAQ